jgi:hypothetical protein
MTIEQMTKPVPERYYRAIDAQRYVRAGAALLDQRNPGWADRIDVTTLRVSNCRACVLGQLYSGFTDGYELGRRALIPADVYVSDVPRGTHYWAIRHGFHVPDGNQQDRFERLRTEWVKAIKARRAR